MAITHCKEFFAPEHAAEHRAFGFTGSAGRARNHPMDPAGEEDGDTYVERRAKGGKASTAHSNDPKGYQLGGMVNGAPSGRPVGAPGPQGQPTGALSNATLSMPVGDAANAMSTVARAGKAAGARQAVNAIANAARLRRPSAPTMPAASTATAAAPIPAPAQQGVPAMSRGGRLRRKDFHPGGSPGKLHRELHIPEGQTIPAGRLEQAAHSHNPEVKRDAIRAETMKKWHHG